MAQEARVSQFVTIIVGSTPPTIEITPDPVAVAAAPASPALTLTLTPSPVSVLGSPLVVGLNTPGTANPDPVVVTAAVPACTITFTEPPPPPPELCRHETGPHYLAMLQQLLPRGAAWTREPEAVLTALLTAIADELSCVDARAATLLEETDPRFALELLEEWERTVGLPDECTGPLELLQDRRAAVVERLTNKGGSSPAYFEAMLAARGFPDARVTEYRAFEVGRSRVGEPMNNPQKPFRVGSSRVGEALTNNTGWLFTWSVLAPDFSFRYFRVGESRVGEPLRTWGNTALECLVNELKPAHTNVVFFYFTALRPDPAGATLTVPAVSLS